MLAVVVVAALAVGAQESSPPTEAERVERIASRVRCPTCRSQSVADSDAPSARAIRDEAARRVAEGQSDGEIVDYLVARYGQDIELTPPQSGVSAVVWVLPVLALAGTVAGLVVAFRRWRPRGRRASAEDRVLVEKALES